MSETSDKSEENVDIIVNYPFLKHEELFSIPTDSNYENIIYTLYEEVATEEDHGRSEGDFSRIVSISVLDPRGYIYMPIQLEYGVDMNTLLIRDNAGIIPLKNEDLVTCSRFSDKFSPRRPINLLLQQIIQDYAFVGVCVSGGVIDYDVRYMELFQDFYAHHGSAFKDQYILATAPFHYFGYRNMSATSNRLSNYSERMKQCTKLPTHLNVNDGNAYYRSVYFGLFEQIIVGKNLHLFGLIADMFRKNGHSVHVHPSSNSDSSDHKPDALIEEDADFQELINTLELASNGIIWNTIAEFEFDILSDEDDNTLDYSCIQAMRYMTSCYIRTHAHQTNADVLKVEGKDVVSPTLADILINSKYYYGCDAHFVNDPVSTSFDDSINSYDVRISEPVSLMSSIDDYCKMHIERMHVEAPDAVIELGLIPLALNCACSLQRVVILQSTVAYHHEKKSKKSKKKEYELRGVTSVIQQVCNGVRNENVEHMENDAKMVTHDYFLAEAEENRHQSSSNDLKPTARCSTSSMNNINVNAFEVKDMMSDRLVEWKPPQDTTNDVYGFLHIYQYEYWLLTTSSNTKEVRRQKVMEIADGIAQLTHLKEETYVHPNAPQGLHNYKLAADRGHTDAQYQLALCYDMGLEGVHESKLNALKYYKLAADSGHTDSQYQLGLIYDLGVEGIAENRLMAIRYYKLAADKGHVDAIHMLLSYGVNIHRSGNTSSKTARQRRCCMRKLYGIMYPLGYFDGGAHKHIHPKAERKTYDSANGSKGATKTPFSSPVRSDSVGIAQPRESSTAFQGTKEDAARIRHALQESPSTPVFLSPNAKVNVSASTNNNGCPPLNPMRSPGVMDSSALKSQSVLTVEVPLTPNNPNVSAGDTGNPNNTWGYSPGRSEMESSGKTPLRLRRTVQSVIRDMKAKKLNHTETFVNTNAASAQFTPTLNLKPGGGGTSKPSKLLGEISSNYLKFSTSTITTALTTGTAATTDNENMSGKSNPPNEVMNDLLETPRMRHDLEGMSNDTETKSPEYQAKKPSPMMRQATWKRSRVEDLEGSDGDEFDDSNGTETSEESDSESDSDGSIFSDEIEEPDESVISEWMVSEQGDHIPRHRYIKFFIHNYKILAAFCRHIANSRIFQYFIFINIVLAGLIVGIQSYPAFAAYNWKFEIINKVILAAFTLEVVVKIVGEEFKPWHYFIDRHFVLNKWNIFDFLIVVLSVMFISVDGSGSRLQFLRVVRVLRFTKLFKRIPQLNMIVRGLTDSISFLSYITLLWAMVIFLYAVFGLLIFSDNDPWHFRSIEYAVFTLFQMTVLDFWGEVMYVNFYGCDEYPSVFYTDDPSLGGSTIGSLMYCEHPEANPALAVSYFVSYIILTSFCIVPLFVAAVFISMSDCVDEMKARSKASYRKRCLHQLERKYQMMMHPYTMSSETKLSTKLLRIGFSGGDITRDIALFDDDEVDTIEETNRWGTFYQLVKKPSRNPYQFFMFYYHVLAFKCGEFVEKAVVRKVIMLNIVLAGCVVGLQTDSRINTEYSGLLNDLNLIVQVAFAVEVVLKIIAEAEHPWMYFTTAWNNFDFLIVLVSFLPISNTSYLVIVRLVKLFRVMKITKELKQLQVVFAGATKGGAAALYIMIVLFIVYYIFAVVANTLFAENDPASWGTVHIGMLVLTQLATLDQWISYANTIIFGCASQPSPLMFDDSQCRASHGQFLVGFLFLAIFTIFGSYILLALFIGSIHIAMEEEQIELMDEERIFKCVRRIKKERGISSMAVARYLKIFQLLDVTYDNRLGIEEVKFGLRVAGEELDDEEFMTLFRTVDEDDSGAIDFSEFVLFMLNMRTLTLGRIEIEKELDRLNSESSDDDDFIDTSDLAFTFTDADILASGQKLTSTGNNSPAKSSKRRPSVISLSLQMQKANVDIEVYDSNKSTSNAQLAQKNKSPKKSKKMKHSSKIEHNVTDKVNHPVANKNLQRKASMANLLTKIAEDGEEDRKKLLRRDVNSKMVRVESYSDMISKIGTEDSRDHRKHRAQKIVLKSIAPSDSPHHGKDKRRKYFGFGNSISHITEQLSKSKSEDLFEGESDDEHIQLRLRNHVLNSKGKKIGHRFAKGESLKK